MRNSSSRLCLAILFALLLLSGGAAAQLAQITVAQLEPDAVTQDFNGEPDGPIGSMAAAFAAIYLTNVSLVGTFVPTGDDLDNSAGDNSLCSRSNVLTVSAPTNLIDNHSSGYTSGWHFEVDGGTATQVAFSTKDEGGAQGLVEVFFGGAPVGSQNFSTSHGLVRYYESAVPYDAFEIRGNGGGGWALDDITIAGLGPRCNITAPAAMALVSGDVAILHDVDHTQGLPVDVSFEFSTDAGATWSLATDALGGPNPVLGVTTPASGLTFLWASATDGVGRISVQVAEFRLQLNDGTRTGGCSVAGLQVDNTALCGGICGDCNENGAGPDILDALTGAQIAAGLITPTMSQQSCCDVNASTTIEVLDALAMAQSAAGLQVTLTCP